MFVKKEVNYELDAYLSDKELFCSMYCSISHTSCLSEYLRWFFKGNTYTFFTGIFSLADIKVNFSLFSNKDQSNYSCWVRLFIHKFAWLFVTLEAFLVACEVWLFGWLFHAWFLDMKCQWSEINPNNSIWSREQIRFSTFIKLKVAHFLLCCTEVSVLVLM